MWFPPFADDEIFLHFLGVVSRDLVDRVSCASEACDRRFAALTARGVVALS